MLGKCLAIEPRLQLLSMQYIHFKYLLYVTAALCPVCCSKNMTQTLTAWGIYNLLPEDIKLIMTQ